MNDKNLPSYQISWNIMLQQIVISQKLLRVPFLHSFTIFASCESISTILFLAAKMFHNLYLIAELKMNSTCVYIHSIRNQGFLIIIVTRACIHKTISHHLKTVAISNSPFTSEDARAKRLASRVRKSSSS